MTNNYVQKFINIKQQNSDASVSHKNALKEKKKALLKSYVRPDNPKGYIIDENIPQSAKSSVTSLAKTGVYFVNAMGGKGTDYTVGRINDGAKFLGSLGIAAVLASKSQNPKAKAMEFAGFATWFSSMALWPKMVGSAVNATKGVDINKEYVDSYGRRKRFFEDAQYITWDLYPDKDLYAMGDKLGVPKNIENRKEAIKEKAKQVATQGNTLMMITAGIATPITTALICNGLEKPVSKAIEMYQGYMADKMLQTGLKNVSKETGLMKGSDKGLDGLTKIIKETEGTANLDVEQSKQLREFFGKHFEGSGLENGIQKELNKHVSGAITLDNKAKEGFMKAFVPSEEALKTILGDSPEKIKKVQEALTFKDTADFNKRIFDNAEKLSDVKEATLEVKSHVSSVLPKNEIKAPQREKIAALVMENLSKEAENHKIISAPVETLRKLFKVSKDFVIRQKLVDNYAKATIANVADSKTANHWANDSIEIFEALGMDRKTKALIAANPGKAPEYIQKHIEDLVTSKKIDRVAEKIAKIAEKVVKRESEAKDKLVQLQKETQENCGKLAKDNNLEHVGNIIEHISGIKTAEHENKLMNTKSSFYRPLILIDRIKDPEISKNKGVIHELITGFGIDFWSNKGDHRGTNNKESFESFINSAFAPIKNILGKKENSTNKANEHLEKSRTNINQFLELLKGKLINVDGANRNFVGNSSAKTGESAIEVGKSLVGFILDASREKGLKNTWFKRVLLIAAPLTIISGIAISQFGKKNTYNPDIYEVKGRQNGNK